MLTGVDVYMLVAVGNDGAIGANNKLPWKCKQEMANFLSWIKGGIIICGKKTWESLPPNIDVNTCFVVSRSQSWSFADGKEHQELYRKSFLNSSIELAIANAVNLAKKTNSRVHVIGGGEVYEYVMRRRLADYVMISVMDVDVPNADTFFSYVTLASNYRMLDSIPTYEGWHHFVSIDAWVPLGWRNTLRRKLNTMVQLWRDIWL